MEVENGKTVDFHYVGKLDDGTEFDNSRDREVPMKGNIGSGELIPGFESALLGMKEGETKTVVIESKDAYGEFDENAVQNIPITSFPEDFVVNIGGTVQGQNVEGQTFVAKILGATDDEVTLDFNHPLAGKNLNFEIEVIAVEDQS